MKLKKILRQFFWSFFSINALVFLLNKTGFLPGIDFSKLLRITLAIASLFLFISLKKVLTFIKKKYLNNKKKRREITIFAALNFLLIFLFVIIIPVFQYGSPLIYEEHRQDFKVAKEIPLIQGTIISQEFKAISNNLGTVGVMLITEEEKEEEKENNLPKSAEGTRIIFRIKEKGSDSYFYENSYYFDSDFKTSFYQFGFPTQEKSKNKEYVIEIEGTQMSSQLAVQLDNQNHLNFYPRYVFILANIKIYWQEILANIARLFFSFITAEIFSTLFFIHFCFILFFFLIYNKKGLNPAIKNSFLFFLLVAVTWQSLLTFNLTDPSKTLNLYLIISINILGFFLFRQEKKLFSSWKNESYSQNYKKLALPILIFILFLGLGLRFYQLGKFDFHGDEFQVVSAATGFYKVGKPCKWDWLKEQPVYSKESGECVTYTRAWPHSWLIAQSFKLFGISEWSARLISVIFGGLLIIFAYVIVLHFIGNYFLALFAAFLFSINPFYISISRYTRMYALLIPLFFLLIYFVFRGITEEGKIFQKRNIPSFFSKYLNFSYFFIFLSLIFLYLNYLIHINSFVLLPPLALFIFYLAFARRKRKYFVLSFLLVSASLALPLLTKHTNFLNPFLYFISFFSRHNTQYLDYLSNFPFGSFLGKIFLFLSFILALALPLKSWLKDRLIYLSLIVGFSLFFFVFVANRYPAAVYISHLTPLAIVLISISWLSLLKIFQKKEIKILLVVLLLWGISSSLFPIKRLYSQGVNGNYSQAYQVIIENYNPQNEAIFGQYLRPYYLKPLNDKAIFMDMSRNRGYSLEQFLTDLEKYQSGWITWETRKSYHLRPEIISYINNNFEKYHGQGIDNTKVEVYYFDQDMVR